VNKHKCNRCRSSFEVCKKILQRIIRWLLSPASKLLDLLINSCIENLNKKMSCVLEVEESLSKNNTIESRNIVYLKCNTLFGGVSSLCFISFLSITCMLFFHFCHMCWLASLCFFSILVSSMALYVYSWLCFHE